jgi:hypothetical protein
VEDERGGRKGVQVEVARKWTRNAGVGVEVKGAAKWTWNRQPLATDKVGSNGRRRRRKKTGRGAEEEEKGGKVEKGDTGGGKGEGRGGRKEAQSRAVANCVAAVTTGSRQPSTSLGGVSPLACWCGQL